MADELEYHVTFPTKFSNVGKVRGQGAAAAASEDVELTDSDSDTDRGSLMEPVIFLLGWNSAEDKELARYSAIYMSEGYITIRYVLPGEFLSSGKLGGVRDIAVKVLEAFFDLGLEDNPIFFHLFSNGGGYVYRAVTEILNGRDPVQFAALKIAGVIWDSAPYRSTFQSEFRALSLLSPNIRSQSWPVAYFKTAPHWAWLMLKHIVLPSYWEANTLMGSYIQAIVDDKMSCPQLYIYSKSDCITWYKDIQEIVEKRRKRGFIIQEAFFEDSGHLKHLAMHHDEYVEACLELILCGIENLEE